MRNLKLKYFTQKHKTIKWPMYSIGLFILMALLAPFIANDKPLICKYKGNWLFPALSFKNTTPIITQNGTEELNYNMGKEWKLLDSEFSIFPLCAYTPNTIDSDNAPLKSPFDKQYITLKNNISISLPLKFRHWLGTTQNGNDVLSGIIHGSKIALGVGFFSMLVASLIGISLGAMAGFYQNRNYTVGYIQFFFLVMSLIFAWFYAYKIQEEQLTEAFKNGGFHLVFQILISMLMFIGIIFLFNWIGRKTDSLLKLKSYALFLPIDAIINRLIVVLNSIPSLLLIIVISSIAKPSYTLLILIIGFLSWTHIARVVRAQYLQASALDYVTACKAIGIPNFKIIVKHILPNIFPIIIVQLIFGMAGVVLVEASLSFIGVGVPLNIITWGSLLNEAQNSFSAWWLVLAPGLCLFALIMCYNKIASYLTNQQNEL